MASFTYTAVDQHNKYIKGTLDARSAKRARLQLEKKGLLVINIKQEKSSHLSELLNTSTIRRLDKILFTRHLHTLLDSGIALDQALKISAEQTGNQSFKRILFDIYQRVKKGDTLHSALGQHPRYFSPFFTNLVKVGEKSGTLDDVLLHLLEQQEQDYELITKTRGAMIYPIVIIIAAVMIIILMMTFVIPTITDLLLEYSVELPLTTKVLIFMSQSVNRYGIFILTFVILGAFLLQRWVKRPRGKKVWSWVKLHIPFLKTIVVEFNMARFSRSMSSLLKSGVPIDEALELTATVCNNVYYENTIRSSISFVRKGIPLTEVLHAHPALYPVMSTRMLEVGEKTGKFDNMFTRLAIFYEKSVLNTINNLSSIIEPVLLLLIGAGVGFIAVSILTPIWKFAQTI